MQTQIINDNSCIRIVNDNVPVLINKMQIKTIDTAKDEMVRIDIGEGPLKQIYIRFSEVTVPAGLADVNALREAIKAMMDNPPIDVTGGGTGVATDISPLVTAAQYELDMTTLVKGSVDGVKAQVLMTGQLLQSGLARVILGLTAVTQQVATSSDAQTQNVAAVKLSVDTAGTNMTTAIAAVTDGLSAFKLNQATLIGNLSAVMVEIRDVLSGANDPFKNPVFMDDTQPNIVYYGYIGNVVASGDSVPPPSVPAFAVQKVSKDANGVLLYQWANGNKQFTNIWDNRAVLQYQMYIQQS